MDLSKIEIVLRSAMCQVKSIPIDSINKPPGYSTNFYPSGSPSGPVPVLRLSSPDVNRPVARVGSTVMIFVDPNSGVCPTIDEAFGPEGQLWYAYYNSNADNFNCCGTATA